MPKKFRLTFPFHGTGTHRRHGIKPFQIMLLTHRIQGSYRDFSKRWPFVLLEISFHLAGDNLSHAKR